jgi:hypothetical protein
MEHIEKNFLERRVIVYEATAFLVMFALIWLDEFADLPYLLFGAGPTPINWQESLFETLAMLPLGLIVIHFTKKLFRRLKYLEGFLAICSSCKKIRDEQGEWQHLERFIHDRSAARFSHGICPECAHKLYPEIFVGEDPVDIQEKKAT